MTSGKIKITLYKQAKAGLKSLFIQTAQVSLGLLIMLLATGGNPPGWIVSASFILGVGLVAWNESKRQLELKDQIEKDEKSSLIKSIRRNRQTEFNLQNSDLSGANLSGANLRSAILFGANLRNSILSRVNFRSSILCGANLSGANLRSAILFGANLRSANLYGANLSDANFYGANLSSANLFDAKVDQTKFGNNPGIDEQLRRNLEDRGAIFIDSPEDPALVKSSLSH